MKRIISASIFSAIIISVITGQITDFPVNESTHKISFRETLQDIPFSGAEIELRIKEWYDTFFKDSEEHLDHVTSVNGRTFIKAHSVFPVNSVENGKSREYTIRMNYDLRFFIRDKELRYELTNIVYGTPQNPSLMSAETLFDEWHLKASKADVKTQDEKLNLAKSYLQYQINTQLVINRVTESLQVYLYPEE